MSADSATHRVYAEFNNLGEFKEKIASSVAELRTSLDSKPGPAPLALPQSAPNFQDGIEWMDNYVNRALKILLSNTPIPSLTQCGIIESANALSMKFDRTELIIRFGRIEECEDKLRG